ncbi:WD40 repeat domain-containing serine/threonine protein kinase [Trebonia kvetii]|uniref:WD40 repeat domain-containing serine/threonine protein kinase n=1 Tax=Trebonia kvetii TaxID=2480626 RepID=UPI001C9E31E8|nr:serine/threonine-protein kinase [Trebonia kvetii]
MTDFGNDAGYPPGSKLVGYRLDEVIGRGGMAIVFRAFDESLNRQVAVKILAPELALDEDFRQRFIRESQLAAQVDHPHIIPVFAAGEADGALYIAMRFVPGGNVGSLVRREGALPAGRAAAIISSMAAALDAAHEAGLVHRDVKPTNMLVDVRPGHPDHIYLSDFGIAKSASTTSGLTQTGSFLGTLEYSAPEQIQGHPVDGRADQYALACSASMILAGSPPFHRDSDLAVLHAQLSEPPAPLAGRVPGIPAAVDQVLQRALAKAPADRYPSCGEFAAALSAALGLGSPEATRRSDHPRGAADGSAGTITTLPPAAPYISAARDSAAASVPPHRAVEGGAAGGRRHRLASAPTGGLVIAVVVAAAILAAGGGVTAAILASGGQRPTASGSPSGTAGSGTAQAAGTSTASPGGSSAASPRPSATASQSHLTSPSVSPSSPADLSPTGAPGGQVTASIVHTVSDAAGGPGQVNSVAFSPVGDMMVTGGKNGEAFLWSPRTGQLITPLRPGAGTKIYSVTFSANGALVAAGASNGSIYLWSAATGQLVDTATDPDGAEIDWVEFSPSGSTLASAGSGYVYLWHVGGDGRTATLSRTLADPLGVAVWSLAFSPDDRTLAAGDYRNIACLWNLSTGAATPLVLAGPGGKGTDQPVTAVAFSPDGSTLATGYQDGQVYLWNIASKALKTVISEPQTVWGLAWSRSGLLAIADNDGSTYLVHGASGQPAGTLTDPGTGSQGVGAVAFSPDGGSLVTGDTNNHAYLWRID